MSKKLRKTGRSHKEPRHVRLYHSMMSAPAWRALDCVSRCAYVELARRYGGTGTNNGRIVLSARELAEALHVSKMTAARALKRLEAAGFIVAMKRGSFNLKGENAATEWRLTEFPCDVTGELPTHAYRNGHNSEHGTSGDTVGCSK